MPLAIGANMDRFVWMCATPVVAAVGRFPARRWVALAMVATAIWPAINLAVQVRWPPDASSTKAYYQPLVAELMAQQRAAGAVAVGQRLEVVDTIDHGASFELSRSFSLARGWDRPADRANNSLFYEPGALTAASYERWLDRLAVGWVALPGGRHDYAARGEAALVSQHLDFLRPAWSSPDWTLFRVVGAQPLASGAAVVRVDAGDVVLRTPVANAAVELRVRYSPYLVTVDPVTGDGVPGCLSPTADGLTQLYLPTAGTVSVTSRFSLSARFRDADSCLQKPNAPVAHEAA